VGTATAIAAVSNVGRVRSNNQDSGYAGSYLLVVADGMGGHAGGDVASALAVKRVSETDQRYETVADPELRDGSHDGEQRDWPFKRRS
jgi:serine/threonine protein phosphatase PrpC